MGLYCQQDLKRTIVRIHRALNSGALWSTTSDYRVILLCTHWVARVYTISAKSAAEKLLAINALIMLYERFGSDSTTVSDVSSPSGEVKFNQINSVQNSRIKNILHHNIVDIYIFYLLPLLHIVHRIFRNFSNGKLKCLRFGKVIRISTISLN